MLMELYAFIVFKDSRDKTGFHKLHVDGLGKLLQYDFFGLQQKNTV